MGAPNQTSLPQKRLSGTCFSVSMGRVMPLMKRLTGKRTYGAIKHVTAGLKTSQNHRFKSSQHEL
jgi:hypothetical protein